MANIYALEEGNGNFVTLSSNDEGGMVGLELDCCTTGEIIGLVVIIAIFVGIPSFLDFFGKCGSMANKFCSLKARKSTKKMRILRLMNCQAVTFH